MLLRSIYYSLKSFIPRKNQLFFRRKLVFVQRNLYKDTWPILHGSEKKPDNWLGWEGNKKFAVVLTHDVEHQRGYNRVEKLMKLEKELGFVSSFNFVPERDYKVEFKLLEKIRANGFEYGVHGLNHDGKLFKNRQIFDHRAEKINKYIKDWNASGFRAPAMHHNLEWIKELNIEYDLSTFDTDPFEPQPDGVGTIFPFWVIGQKGKNSYVEMPYTLVQDFTLFILMKEKSPAIWIKKLDWIAKNGGMVLLNVHPDYLNFENESTMEEFPVKYYEEFLSYLKSNYNGQYWNALPIDVSNYYKNQLANQKLI
jgi:hypothetical protein